MLVYWEMTQACGLACKHCRAEAMPTPHPLELNHADSKAFLNQLVGFGDPLPHLILTGGDPLSRKDIYELIDYGCGLGLEVSITPSATAELTNDAITQLKAHRIQSLGLSLDGSCAAKHDAIRAIPGTFDRTVEAARHAGRLGLPIQVNTLVAEETIDDLPAIYELLRTSFPVMRWSLFFLISVGRGKALNEVSPADGEEMMNWVLDLVPYAPFAVKTTEAPSYRRLALDRVRTSVWRPRNSRTRRSIRDSRFAMATESCLFPTWERFIPRASCRCPAATCAASRWWRSTATLRYSARCILRISFSGAAEPANTSSSAADRELAPSPTAAIFWKPTPSAPTCRQSSRRPRQR